MTNMKHLKDKPIAILGGGTTGRCQAADCALAKREVRLYELPEFAKELGKIIKTRELRLSGPQVNLYGFKRDGLAKIDTITTDMKEAVEGAGIISVSIPAIGFKAFFEKLIPHLEDGMIIHFCTGNFGSLLLRKMMHELGCDKKVIIGEWSSQPYGVRIKTEGGVKLPELNLLYRAITLRGATLPSTDQSAFLESAQYFPPLDSVVNPVEGDTVIDIGLSNVNPMLHVPGTILGVGVMENWGIIFGHDKYDFSIYSHAYCPSISEIQYAFYQEERQIAEAIGVGIQPFDKQDFFSRTNILGAEFMGPDVVVPFTEQFHLLKATGPYTIHNRYITEDVPVGCHIFYELGKKFGVQTPIIESFITLASVMTKIDFFQTGVTLKDLGIAKMNKTQLLKYLHEGL
ncbi:MAG: NAD/NADP octopine/nopaline dehydrogenase family protein [Promethearchaeota archaeon]